MDPDAVDAVCGRLGLSPSPTEDQTASDAEDHNTTRLRNQHETPQDDWLLDFSSTTNPAIPTGAVQAYQSAFAASRSYPSDCYCEFRLQAAEYVGCDPAQVIPTPGRPAALRLALATTIGAGDSVLLPEPSFEGYEREVALQGAQPTYLPLAEIPSTDPGRFDLVVVSTPNDPTGRAYDPRALSAFADRCRKEDTQLVVDEAFLDFTELPSMAGRDGVIVVRSLTKVFGFPGLRVGFAVATGVYRDRLDIARLPWGLGEPSVALAIYCMEDDSFVADTRKRVARERKRLRDRLGDRFDIAPSDAPFLLLDAGSSERVDAAIEQAREADIAVRDARTFRGLDSHLRITVRHPKENDRLIDALSDV